MNSQGVISIPGAIIITIVSLLAFLQVLLPYLSEYYLPRFVPVILAGVYLLCCGPRSIVSESRGNSKILNYACFSYVMIPHMLLRSSVIKYPINLSNSETNSVEQFFAYPGGISGCLLVVGVILYDILLIFAYFSVAGRKKIKA
jgi:hypothetical protein